MIARALAHLAPAERRSARHDEAPTEDGCIFALALVITSGIIIFMGMLA